MSNNFFLPLVKFCTHNISQLFFKGYVIISLFIIFYFTYIRRYYFYLLATLFRDFLFFGLSLYFNRFPFFKLPPFFQTATFIKRFLENTFVARSFETYITKKPLGVIHAGKAFFFLSVLSEMQLDRSYS